MKTVSQLSIKCGIIILAILFLKCQPKPNTADLVKNLVVNTQFYEANANFGNFSTYSLQLDTISYFNTSSYYYPKDTLQCIGCQPSCYPNTCDNYNNYFQDYLTTITGKVKDNLDAAGYNRVLSSQNPDLKIYILIIENYSVTQGYTYYPYGYGYYGYGGYGYAYPTYSVSDEADLYIEIFDLKHLNTKGKPSLIWASTINDLVSSPDIYNLTSKAIDQAFKQSPYIKKI